MFNIGDSGSVSTSFWVGSEGKGLEEGIEKGLLAGEVEVENGLENAEFEVEKGFEDEPFRGFTPNNFSPRPLYGSNGCFAIFSGSFGFSFLFFTGTSLALTPRITRTLPSLRRHVLRLHEKTYSRLSWPGKNSGRSPLSCKSRTMGSLQTLHFASAAEGGLVESSHV